VSSVDVGKELDVTYLSPISRITGAVSGEPSEWPCLQVHQCASEVAILEEGLNVVAVRLLLVARQDVHLLVLRFYDDLFALHGDDKRDVDDEGGANDQAALLVLAYHLPKNQLALDVARSGNANALDACG
jgi:hypothetical protein